MPVAELRLLVEPEPQSRVFVQNLRGLFQRPKLDLLNLKSTPAAFWPDVFVHRGLPWNGFLDSVAVHVLALTMIWLGSRFLGLEPQAKSQPAFTHADILFYTPSEYLPPLDTRRPDSAPAREPDPEFSTQPIISLPREADTR